ncbi:hypothetical protein PC39_14597 [Salinisphaera sp. PC39]|uniref:hypothetical protein n=1 Tax=Salinisphaera sp. PC39 TaxID=1304156 RepID=UPI00333FBFF6
MLVLAGQLAVAGQAFALPDCHGSSPGNVSHADMGHAMHVEDAGGDAADCHCPQGMNCGHCAATIAKMASEEMQPSTAKKSGAHPSANLALAHKAPLEKPPSTSRS